MRSAAKNTIVLQDNRLMVSGDLNFSTVMNVWQESFPLLAQCKELHFDLAKVTSANSAGLALLLEWIRYAKKANKTVKFVNIPSQLTSMAATAGIQAIF